MTGPGGSRGGDGPADPGDGPRGDDAPTEPTPAVNPPTEQMPPADPATEHLPPVEAAGGGTAWSQYPEGEDPTRAWTDAGAATAPEPGPQSGPVPQSGYAPPPGDVPPPGGGGWDDRGGDGRAPDSTPWVIVAVLLAIALVAGLIVWLVSSGGDSPEPVAAPPTTPPPPTSTPRPTTPSPPTPTTTGPPGLAERCSPGFVADEVGEGTSVRECDGRFLLVSREGGELELLSWRDDTGVFLAEPTSDVCREQLEQLGVPDRFRRVFQPCGRPTTSSSTSTSSPTSADPTTTSSEETVTTVPAGQDPAPGEGDDDGDRDGDEDGDRVGGGNGDGAL